jgi:predicted transcriptional regulator
MSKTSKRQTATMTDVLREAVVNSQIPLLRLAKETGIARASLIRFTRGDTSLRLDVADKLAEFFDLELVKNRKAK